MPLLPFSTAGVLVTAIFLVGIGIWIYVAGLAYARIEVLPRGERNPIAWGLLAGLFFILFYVVAQSAGGLILNKFNLLPKGYLLEKLPDSSLKALIITLLLIHIALLVSIFLYLRFKRAGLRSIGIRREGLARAFIIGFGGECMAYPLVAAAALLTKMIGEMRGVPWQPQSAIKLLQGLRGRPWGYLVSFIIIAVFIAPLVEELLFRSLLQQGLRRYMRPQVAIILSALLFALLHETSFAMPPVFIIGLFLGYLYERTQNLAVNYSFHMIHNAVAAYAAISIG